MISVPSKSHIQLFVDALRSGEYQQGNRVLGYTEGGVEKFCCLGVATEVAMKHGVKLQRILGNPGCEAIIGWVTDNSGKPLLNRCFQPGIERPDVVVLKWATILCGKCYAAIMEKRKSGIHD